ncbi:signal peptidase I [Ihubacter sp. rT4E-8]|uniref:signal peptidase I n=1 Tax=Ihubacter sp. rT4E-8 TaxID=3242369 RepID=UPI0013799A9E
MKEWIKSIALALAIALVVIYFIKPTLVKQSSMEPNFYENDYLFVSKQSYKLFGSPERGDVIVVHSDLVQENGDEKMLIKRIIGLPGDSITITDDKVYINGEAIEEPYIKEQGVNGAIGKKIKDLVVPENSYFCMGDNRRVSIDSRDPDVGCVGKDQIVGKVVLRLYPFNKIGFIKNPLKE